MSLLRRLAAVGFTLGLFVTAAQAQSYSGAGSINLNSVPKSNFEVVTYLSIYNGSNYDTIVSIFLGNYSAYSETQAGSADAYIYYHHVNKAPNGSWSAGDVTIYELNSDWSWNTQVYNNVSIPSTLSSGGYGYWGDAAFYQPYTFVN